VPGGYHRFSSEAWHYEDSRSPPPRHISALPLVVTAVLSLAFAGAAHAVSVDIVIPRTDPYEVRQYQRRYFEGVCHDARGKM